MNSPFALEGVRWCIRCCRARPEEGGYLRELGDGTKVWLCGLHRPPDVPSFVKIDKVD